MSLRGPALFPFFLALALLVACTSQNRGVVKKVIEPREPKGWIGRTVAELEAAWGQPASVQADGIGGKILTYTKVIEYREGVPVHPVHVPESQEPRPRYVPQTSLEIRESKPIAEFRIDGAGKIYEHWIRPKYLKKAHLRPPYR